MYNGPIVKAAVYPGFDDNDKGNPIRIYARIQEDITMKQDIYDLTVAYILENQEKCYRLGYRFVQGSTGTVLWMWCRIPYARHWKSAGDSGTRRQ